jgi:hypothetical protein
VAIKQQEEEFMIGCTVYIDNTLQPRKQKKNRNPNLLPQAPILSYFDY